MTKTEITKFLEQIEQTKDRTIAIVDFSNVTHWEDNLGWEIGIKELKDLIKHFTAKQFLRRFYYGSDFGEKDESEVLTAWSEMIINKARMNSFEICTKRVKYIKDKNYKKGFVKKCDLDVEMAVDLIKEKNNYDNIVVFSGDGDLSYVLKFLKESHGKKSYVFAARNHLGKELVDCMKNGQIEKILFVEDFEYRLNKNRLRLK
jgi:uncharacterized LabA/DUF88 family protein